jgi:fucose 4-O-acetylase-like acetyltransferase
MVLFPFLIVTGLHVILNLLFTGSPRFDPVVAQYTLWFLVAVLCWRVGAPYLMRFRHPLLISVIVSLASGVFASLWVFRIDSVAGFFPFFVIGLMLRENDTWLRTRTVGRGVTAAAIVAAWMALVSVIHHFNLIDRSAIGMVGDYGDGVIPNLIGSALRIGILAGGSAAALAVLHLMPRRFIPVISYVGAGGFTIYLMHGLVLRVLNRFGLLPTVADGEWALWVLVVFAFVLALVLGSKPVRRIVAPIVRPKARWLLIPDTRAKKPEPSAHEPRRVHPGSRAGEALGGR